MSISDNIQSVCDRMDRACVASGRRPEEVTLVAVTKTQAPSLVQQVVDAGIRNLGENYFQEAREKLGQVVGEQLWHFIGHLQTNKARYIVGNFASVQSVDSLALATELGRRASAQGVVQAVLVEVKLDADSAKFGVPPDETSDFVAEIAAINGLRVDGLMGMAPFGDDPESARPHFRRLKSLFDALPALNRRTLSMGMTGDFEVAIQEGSTMVRVGTAIFGRRT